MKILEKFIRNWFQILVRISILETRGGIDYILFSVKRKIKR